MTVMILERVAASQRGELSKWLLEVKTGVFVGRLSGLVRDRLWEHALRRAEDRDATIMQVWSSNTEQGFDLRVHNPKDRIPENHEGLWLVRIA